MPVWLVKTTWTEDEIEADETINCSKTVRPWAVRGLERSTRCHTN
jgi:hypothetical protein